MTWMNFVGGKMDDTDYHEIECALRETEEEIGLGSEFIDVSHEKYQWESIVNDSFRYGDLAHKSRLETAHQ